ncbi:MAG: flavodoxin family protein [Coriobacteriales bacterium]
MSQTNARICLIMGSPAKGSTNRLAGLVEQGILEAGGSCSVFSLADHVVSGCIACDHCLKTGVCFKNDDHEDDFYQLDEMLDVCDALVVVTPVYFAGPPSQLKAVYDRFQPNWARRYIMGEPAPEKRPATLFVLGGGDDPFGYDPLVTITRSALNIAGFRLGDVHDFIGFGHGTYPLRMESDAIRLGRSIAEKY